MPPNEAPFSNEPSSATTPLLMRSLPVRSLLSRERGAITWVTAGNHRLAILVTGIYFVIGLLIISTLDVARGRRAALEPET